MKFYSILLLIISIFLSCSVPPTEVKLSQQDYKVVDSLVKVQKKLVKTEIDSLCKLIETDYYNKAFDSIKSVRLEYISEIMNK